MYPKDIVNRTCIWRLEEIIDLVTKIYKGLAKTENVETEEEFEDLIKSCVTCFDFIYHYARKAADELEVLNWEAITEEEE